MSESNDLPVRTEVFAWIRDHEHVFYDPRQTVDPIGVYFSPQTRNYFPREFTGAFKGAMNVLLKSHREFQIVTPRTLSSFHGRLLIVPAAQHVAGAEMASLHSQSEHRFELATSEISASALPPQKVSVTASPSAVAQIAQVHGKLHVFLDNFGEKDTATVSFPATAGSEVHVLPFLGTASKLPAQKMGDQLIAKIPGFQGAVVVWCE